MKKKVFGSKKKKLFSSEISSTIPIFLTHKSFKTKVSKLIISRRVTFLILKYINCHDINFVPVLKNKLVNVSLLWSSLGGAQNAWWSITLGS
jgi:hypothetical protein